MLAERRLQIEAHLEQYQAVVQEHLHGHRHVSEHVKFPKQQYKVTVRSLQNLKDAKPALKAKNSLMNLPYVMDGDVVVTQSQACLQYLARKLGLYGEGIVENAKIVLEYREVHLQSVLQAISSRRSSNAIEEGCWCLQYTQPLTSHSPPVSSMLTTTTTTTKSWRSDTLIILPGWECHTGGSRSKPTVHRCSQSGRRLWVAQSTTTSPMAQPQCSKKQCINVNNPKKKKTLWKRVWVWVLVCGSVGLWL